MGDPEVVEEEPGLRRLLAANPGPFTLEGTRTYLLGFQRVAVIDPGPAQAAHVEGVLRAVGDARDVVIVLTHGHADHAAAAPELATRLGASVLGAGPVHEPLPHGARISTDAGELEAVDTPGHASPHLAFLWRERGALFAGDLVLGRGETTWVAGYPGCVADYLGSLERVRTLGLRRIYPAHGPPIDDVGPTLDRFRDHRHARIAQVRDVLARNPRASPREILLAVYGDAVPPGLEEAALESVTALLDHLEAAAGG